MINLNEISIKFKTDFWTQPFWALENVSFEIPEGELIGFLGANGAGKTTLFKIIMQFIKPTSGQIIFDKRLGHNHKEIFSRIGFLPERPFFYPHLTGREFITYLAKLNDLTYGNISKLLNYWGEKLRIDFALDRKIRTYSKGMLQRLGFISAIIHDPWVVILDEPLSGLDPIGRREIKDAIVEINERGKTVFFSGHIVSDIEEVCKSVLFMEKGKVLFNGNIKKLIQDQLRPNYLIDAMVPNPELLLTKNRSVKSGDGHDSTIFEVDWDHKDEFVNEVISKNGKIYSLNLKRIGLEEIFYKVKK